MDICKKILLFLAAACITLPAFSQTTFQVFASSRGTNSVKYYDENGTYLGDFVSPGGGGLSTTEDILFHPDGTVLVTGYGNTAIKRYNGSTGASMGDFSTGYSLASPSKMSIGPDSLIYVTQWSASQNKVARFDLQGNFVDEFTDTGAPNGLGHVWDAEGNFYIALFGTGQNGTVNKFDTAGNYVGQFVNSAVLQGPTSIWWDSNGDMLVEDWTVGNVLRYDSAGNYVGVFINGLSQPEGVAFTPDGNILMGDWGLDVLHSFDSLGVSLGNFASGNGLTDPNSVKVRDGIPIAITPPTLPQTHFSVHPSAIEETAWIRFELAVAGSVSFDLIDLNGKVVEEIGKNEYASGAHEMTWRPSNGLAAAVYHVRLRTGDLQQLQRVVLLR